MAADRSGIPPWAIVAGLAALFGFVLLLTLGVI